MDNKDDKLPILNVGVVGHIDHGKTTLLQKLSGVWASRHSEELKRGISIKLGYADIVIYYDKKEGYNIHKKGEAVRRISFVDAPGHEMLMATMLSGAAMIDAAILVVAANEGIKPQTIEHLSALQAKRVKNLIVVQNKIDLVDKEQAKKNHEDIKKLLKGKYDDAIIIPVSALQEVGIGGVYEALVNVKIPERRLNDEPVFIVARSFDVNKPGVAAEGLKGCVLGGTLKCGKLKVGDEIELKPGRAIKTEIGVKYEIIKTKIRKLFVGSKNVDELTPGGSMSIETELDMAMGKSDALAGNIVGIAGKLPELANNLELKFELFPEVYGLGGHEKVENLKKSEMLMLSINTSTTGGNVIDVKGDKLKINLKVPVIGFRGDNAGIARNIKGHWRLIGYGEIL
jgi:translation initiation factor 2 subunit 3